MMPHNRELRAQATRMLLWMPPGTATICNSGTQMDRVASAGPRQSGHLDKAVPIPLRKALWASVHMAFTNLARIPIAEAKQGPRTRIATAYAELCLPRKSVPLRAAPRP